MMRTLGAMTCPLGGLRAAALAACALALAAPALSGCLSDAEVDALMAAYVAVQPAANPAADLSAADGVCTRAKFNQRLQARHGAPVGYKAGLTNPAVQKRFNTDAPVRGTLYAPMLLADGASVAAGFGARPVFEADLLVRVGSAAINQASTHEQVLAAIDQVIPFIELADMVVAAPPKLNGAAINAINVGARLGVTGTPIPVQGAAGLADALKAMQVVVKVDGQEAGRAPGAAVLGHPLNAVTWLVQDLAREGIMLKPGDLLSLGSFSKPTPPAPGMKVEVRYEGLPGDPQVGVSFR